MSLVDCVVMYTVILVLLDCVTADYLLLTYSRYFMQTAKGHRLFTENAKPVQLVVDSKHVVCTLASTTGNIGNI